jgi:spoIIIJ-associated protein
MSQEKTTLEIIAPTVEEAIARGVGQLGLPREAVDIEILDAGSRGLFGLGSRQARIRLTIKVANQSRQAELSSMETSPGTARQKPATPVVAVVEESQPQEDDPTLKAACEVVTKLLESMKVKSKITARYVQSEEAADEQAVLVDIQGDDLSILIGRRSETLNALQYLASLIVGKEVGHWVSLVIDVQGYRSRRERQLRQLARRMADQAIHTGRRQVLEPMPANERRLIHLELRDHPQVATESIGDEPNRKVTIFLKK